MDAVSVAIRFALYLDLAALFGLAAFGLYGLRGDERRSGAALAFRPLLAALGLLGLLFSAVGLATLAAAMIGAPLREVDLASVRTILSETAVGTAWIVRMAALGLVLVLVLASGARPKLLLAGSATAGGAALGSLAWAGHGAMHEGAIGVLHLSADILHLLAAGIWVGALVALVLLVFRRSDRVTAGHLQLSHRALEGFSLVGALVVGTLVVTGVANLLFLVEFEQLTRLPATLYGQLLVAKLLAFAAMLGLAAANRFRLVPAFERALAADDYRSALDALRTSLAVETTGVIAILALVAWLGTLEPIAG